MSKKSKILRIASFLLVLCFISTVMISGTLAKYTSEYSGQDTALVAKWSFTGNFDEKGFNTYDGELPIWDHDYVTNIYEKDVDNYLIAPGVEGKFTVDFSYDADVDADLTFKFTKSGNLADNEAAKVPIQYSLDNFETIYYDLDELADAIIAKAETNSTSTITPANGEGQYVVTDTATKKAEASSPGPILVNQTVSWRWPYNVANHNINKLIDANFIASGETWTDADDTAIGYSSANSKDTLGRDSYVLELEIKATQRAPETKTETED